MKLILFSLVCLLLPFGIFSQNIDINILKEINLNRNKQLDNTFDAISNSVTPISMGGPLLLYGLSFIKKDSVMRENSYYIVGSVLSTAIMVTILKHTINRPRPFETYPFIEKEASGGSPSFPSGHSSDAFAFATSLSLSYPKWYVIAPSFAWASAVGYSRMDLGVHYPSDVIAGALLGTTSAYLCYKGNQWLHKKKKKKNGITKFD